MESTLTRRTVLRRALSLSGLAGISALPYRRALAQETAPASTTLALALARSLNRTKFGDLSPTAIKHAKMLIASTLASAAPGSLIGSVRIVRDLAKEQGGKPEATVW